MGADLRGEKKWYQSKTVWAGVFCIGSVLLNKFGYHITPELQGQMAEAILTLVTSLTGAAAVYGRVKATKKIK